MSSVKKWCWRWMVVASSTQLMKMCSPTTDPWGTSNFSCILSDSDLSKRTCCVWSEKIRHPVKDHPDLNRHLKDFYENGVINRLVSKAPDRSSKSRTKHQYDPCRLLVSCRCAGCWRLSLLGDMGGRLTDRLEADDVCWQDQTVWHWRPFHQPWTENEGWG